MIEVIFSTIAPYVSSIYTCWRKRQYVSYRESMEIIAVEVDFAKRLGHKNHNTLHNSCLSALVRNKWLKMYGLDDFSGMIIEIKDKYRQSDIFEQFEVIHSKDSYYKVEQDLITQGCKQDLSNICFKRKELINAIKKYNSE